LRQGGARRRLPRGVGQVQLMTPADNKGPCP
jgi:hypothetical protein